MQRRLLLVLAAVVVAGLAAATYLLAREPAGQPSVPTEQAQARAVGSCRELAHFDELIRSNASSTEVRAVLDRAVRQARVAAAADPIWLSLAGGAQSLQLALDADDARAARVGIDVVRSACRPTGVGP